MWDAETGKQFAVLQGHTGYAYFAAFSPDGARVVTPSPDKTARLWDAATGRQLAVLRGHTDEVSSVAFSHDGSRILTASRDRTIRLWIARESPDEQGKPLRNSIGLSANRRRPGKPRRPTTPRRPANGSPPRSTWAG
jgi:WD40 repeat protein